MAGRILIVEDNAANLELMVYLLNASGYDITSAGNGKEGLAAARENSPDLVVCDVQMPEMNGYELVKALKSDDELRTIPVVAVTAFAMVGDDEKALAAGFDAYISKPIDPEQFLSRIAGLLAAGQHSAAALQVPPTGPAEAGAGERRPRILVVDNVQANLNLAQAIFGYAGYDTLVTSDATEALAMARERQPDLILSDVCMPVTSGYDLIAAVKADARLRHIPFLFLTSTAITDAERAHGLSLGAKKYLVRPLESECLLAEVDACLQRG